MKWKIEGSSAHKHERTLQFFTFFPAIYSTYTGSARKNRAGFSHVRVCGLCQTNFPPVIYAYIQSRRRSEQAWRLESTVDISCLWWMQTWLKSAQMTRHGYNAIYNQRPELVCLISYRQVANRQLHIILRWKKCVNVHKSPMKKCDDVSEYSYEKCEWCWLWW